ncbi:MAG TPA: SRPBCC domain-containing protein [Gaiellaceae bacterium]|nr:SRPBCC domain-containing protein [Gaiellaceae bacterium]
MAGGTTVLGSLHSVDGEGVVRMEDRFDTGIDDVWGAITDPDRLAHWYGEVEGELSQGGEFRVRIALAGERTGQVEVCEPPRHLLLRMRDPDARPGQPERTAIEAQLIAEGARTRLVWETRGMPVDLLPAYGAGIQIHVEHLADYIAGRELHIDDARWDELFAAYEALGVS